MTGPVIVPGRGEPRDGVRVVVDPTEDLIHVYRGGSEVVSLAFAEAVAVAHSMLDLVRTFAHDGGDQ